MDKQQDTGFISLQKRFFGEDLWKALGEQLKILLLSSNACILTYLPLPGQEEVFIDFAPLITTEVPEYFPTFLTSDEYNVLEQYRRTRDAFDSNNSKGNNNDDGEEVVQ